MTCDGSKKITPLNRKYIHVDIECDLCGGDGISKDCRAYFCPQCDGKGTIVILKPKETINEGTENGK